MGKSIDLGNYRELEKITKNIGTEFSRITSTIEKIMTSPAGKLGAVIAGAGYAVGTGLKMTGSYMQFAGQEKQVAIDYALNRAGSIFQEQQARMQMMYSGNVAGVRDLVQYGGQAKGIAEKRFGAREEQLKGQVLQSAGGMTDLNLTGAMMGGGMKMGVAGGVGAGALSGGAATIPGAIAGFVTGTAMDIIKQLQNSAQNTSLARQQLDEFRKTKDIFIMSQIRELATRLAQMDDPFARAMEDVIQPRIMSDVQSMKALGTTEGNYYSQRAYGLERGLSAEQPIAMRQRLQSQGFTGRSQFNLTQSALSKYGGNRLAGTFEQQGGYMAATAMYGGGNTENLRGTENRYEDAATQLAAQNADIANMSANATFTKGAPSLAQGQTDAMISGAMRMGATQDQANMIAGRVAGKVSSITTQTGTIENQVLRTSIRGALQKAGVGGTKLLYAEQYLSNRSPQEIQQLFATDKNGNLLNRSLIKNVFGLNDKQALTLKKSFVESNLKILQAEGASKSTIEKIQAHKNLNQSELFEVGSRLIPGFEQMSLAEGGAASSSLVASLEGRRGKTGTGARPRDEATENAETYARTVGTAQAAEEHDVRIYNKEQGARIKNTMGSVEDFENMTPQQRADLKKMGNKEKANLNGAAGSQTELDKAVSHFVTVISGAATAIESAFKTGGMTVGGTH